MGELCLAQLYSLGEEQSKSAELVLRATSKPRAAILASTARVPDDPLQLQMSSFQADAGEPP